jgi:type I restriction enzyme S subunit
MGRYKAYPAYKNSGFIWLGKIPEAWTYSRVRWLAKVYAGGTPSKTIPEYWEHGTIPWIASGEVNQKIVTEPTTHITNEAYKNSSAKWIPKGSLVMALAGQGKTKGMVAQLAIDTTCNQSLAAIVPLSINSKYLYFWLDSNYRKLRGQASDEDRDGLNLEIIGSVPVPVPTKFEQERIAAFLEHETSKMDMLIAKQRRLIELLREKRRAVISRVITKGLNPDVQMKDSGVAWLGEVPEHWNVMQLRRVTRLQQGLQIAQSERFYEGGEFRLPYITIKTINSPSGESSEFIEKPPPSVVAHKDDVLLARTGATGEVVTDVVGVFHNNFFKVIYQSDKICKGFLVNFLRVKEVKEHLLMMAGTTTIPDLNHGAFLSTKIALPPLQEQELIYQSLALVDKMFTLSVQKVNLAVSLLKERRTALISAAVTGKIDVRDWKPPAQEEPEREGVAV